MGDNPRIEELRRRVQADPASIAFASLAEEYRRAGRFEDAIATCEAGLKRHPSYLSAHVTLGRALLETGRFEEAQQELELVLGAAPENLAAIRGLAEIHQKHRGRDGEHSQSSYEEHAPDPAPAAAPITLSTMAPPAEAPPPFFDSPPAEAAPPFFDSPPAEAPPPLFDSPPAEAPPPFFDLTAAAESPVWEPPHADPSPAPAIPEVPPRFSDPEPHFDMPDRAAEQEHEVRLDAAPRPVPVPVVEPRDPQIAALEQFLAAIDAARASLDAQAH